MLVSVVFFLCRVCTAKYSETCVNLRLYSGVEEGYEPELFSEDAYDKFADIAVINGESNAESCGLKAHCLFNSFKSYHCSTGMPPCLGHDFFEGVFSQDCQRIRSQEVQGN